MVQVPSGIISFLAHPPYIVLTKDTSPGALTAGPWSITRTRGPIGVDAFGLGFSFFTVPAAFGWSQRVHKVYELPIVEWAAVYLLRDGSTLYGETHTLYEEGEEPYFEGLIPTQCNVWVQAGCVVIPRWLVAL